MIRVTRPRRGVRPSAGRRFRKAQLVFSVGLLVLMLHGPADATGLSARPDCPPAGGWIAPPCTDPLAVDQLIAALAERPVVLLGENHNDADHHLWQLVTLGALYGRRPDMVIGFEAFPRRVQPVLDRWVAGELEEAAFLEQTEWKTVWGYDPQLYMPLFRFARMMRVPMVALNVERSLVKTVGKEGLAAVPIGDREGVGVPVDPPAAYRDQLAAVYGWKAAIQRGEADYSSPPTLSGEERSRILSDEGFSRFIEAQAVWDRAMAEALVSARARPGTPLVVGIVGRGHVEHGWGIPHQLAALGLPSTATMLAVRQDDVCAGLAADIADAVFVLEPASPVASTTNP